MATHFSDAIASAGVDRFRVSGGYIYTNFNPYTYYDQPAPPPAGNSYYFPRNEVSLGVSSKWGDYRFVRQRAARPSDQPDGHGQRRCDL